MDNKSFLILKPQALNDDGLCQMNQRLFHADHFVFTILKQIGKVLGCTKPPGNEGLFSCSGGNRRYFSPLNYLFIQQLNTFSVPLSKIFFKLKSSPAPSVNLHSIPPACSFCQYLCRSVNKH